MGDSSDPSRAAWRRRAVAAIALAVVVVTGLVVHRWAPSGIFSDITGDALYAVAAYLAVVIVVPRATPVLVGAIALGWCVAVELFQLTGLPLAWGADIPPLRLVLGTGFDPRDLLVYGAAVAASVLVDLVVARATARMDTRGTGHRRPRV